MNNPDLVKNTTQNGETETGFTVHTLDTAPEESQPLLAQSIGHQC